MALLATSSCQNIIKQPKVSIIQRKKGLRLKKNPHPSTSHTKDSNFQYARILSLITFKDVKRIWAKYSFAQNVTIISSYPTKLDHYDPSARYATFHEEAFEVGLRFLVPYLIISFLTPWA